MYTRFIALGTFAATEIALLRRGNYAVALSLGILAYNSAEAIDNKLINYFP